MESVSGEKQWNDDPKRGPAPVTPFELPDGIDIEWIGNRMAVNARYPAVYYGVSLGRRDALGRVLLGLRDSLTDGGARFNTVPEDALRTPEARNTSDRFREVAGRYVRYRFIRPFFAERLPGLSDSHVGKAVFHLAAEGGDVCPYRILGSGSRATALELSAPWAAYFLTHQAIPREWAKWHLSRYLARFRAFGRHRGSLRVLRKESRRGSVFS